MAPRITVITPSLNQARFLERTIRSVVEQGYPELEFLVFDGGSTDGSVEILRRYDDRIAYWESVPDRGQSHAINKGLERATGEVVAYLNSDDYYLPGTLDAVGKAFESAPGTGWVCGACRYLDPDGSVSVVWRPQLPQGPRPLWARDVWYVPQASSFWRRSEVQRVGGFREDFHYAMDVEFGIRLALAGVLPMLLDRELAVRAHHEEAKSADTSRWDVEYARLRSELVSGLPLRERAAAHLHRARRAARALRDLAERGRDGLQLVLAQLRVERQAEHLLAEALAHGQGAVEVPVRLVPVDRPRIVDERLDAALCEPAAQSRPGRGSGRRRGGRRGGGPRPRPAGSRRRPPAAPRSVRRARGGARSRCRAPAA